jgi:hypothetical protein
MYRGHCGTFALDGYDLSVFVSYCNFVIDEKKSVADTGNDGRRGLI